jgi:predicted nuclease of predicted toxin-antitoxin system
VKLLFDQNLSPLLAKALEPLYPGSIHVRNVNLSRASDEDIWNYAGANDLTIISKDSDFQQRSFLFGHPPKVVWIRCGNCSTKGIEALLRSYRRDLESFGDDPDGAFLALG